MIRAVNSKATMTAVAYYRMSSKKQDTSIPAQRVEVERYAEQHGYNIIRWKPYVDEGISGSESEKREGFQRLIADATKGEFQVILCWDQDRFSRFDPLEANHYWFLLRQSGVRIVTVRQGELDLNQLAGWLVASINQHGKAQYLKDLSANVLRGRLRKAEKGLWAGSRAPFGYALTPESKLVLGLDENVATVRYIFDEYTEKDTSLRQIAFQLNRSGIPTPTGKRWTGSLVQSLLRRETYIGSAAQFTVSKGKFNTIRGAAVSTAKGLEHKPRDQWFKVDCPQIISQEQWDLAQKKNEASAHSDHANPRRRQRGC
jgi:site-specific DNA recombinase